MVTDFLTVCNSCSKSGSECDYSVRLNWLGKGSYRPGRKRKAEEPDSDSSIPLTLKAASTPSLDNYVNAVEARRGAGATDPLLPNSPSLASVSQTINTLRPSQIVLDMLGKDAEADHSAVSSFPLPQDAVFRPRESSMTQNTYTSCLGNQSSPRKRANYGSQPPTRTNTSYISDVPSPSTTAATPGDQTTFLSPSIATTPASSTSGSRGMSVQSLLTTPLDAPYLSERRFSGHGRSSLGAHTRVPDHESATFYGYDWGDPDRDLGMNEDDRAISGYFANTFNAYGTPAEDGSRERHPADLGFGMRRTGNYYEKRVEIWIPKDLEPLPDKLHQNPMNLLYFHHFLNHTARVLVPHDDPHSNPFCTVLPRMALKHDNLLSLLLAYSASHRARHLQYSEPTLRIAHLVQGVISDLSGLVRQAMHEPNTVISTADLATAIMLASLEIISPAAIGGSIPWHHHLNLARELVSRMPNGFRRITPAITQDDRVRALLWSWFAYLDVLGSLSGGPSTLLTPSCYTTTTSRPENDDEDEDMERIDCILGFTPRCVLILARIASLARHVESIRSHQPDWTPDPATLAAATDLEHAALRSLSLPSRPCSHVDHSTFHWNRSQMGAANRAFHHAALIHLHRRVLRKDKGHRDVRAAVLSVLECLEDVERGSSAETCLLFPMFTAGCELMDERERDIVLRRIAGVERTGMMQVTRARRLMERVWETGIPWERLVESEFIG